MIIVPPTVFYAIDIMNADDLKKLKRPQIYADEGKYKHQQLTDKVIGVFYAVYNELGHGFLESVL